MSDKTRVPDGLNRMIDVVLTYRPKPKTKATKKRARQKKKLEKQKDKPS